MCALIATGWVRDWRKAVTVLAGAIVAIVAGQSVLPFSSLVFKIVSNPGAMLVPNFMLGSLLYLQRHRIPYSPALFAVGVATVLASGFLLPEATFSALPAASIILSPVYAYLTLFIGTSLLPRMPLFDGGDYSYGIYLYGFPLQQSIVALTGIRAPLPLFAAAIIPVVGIAMLSWHLVEKPTPQLRRSFSMAAKIEAGRTEDR